MKRRGLFQRLKDVFRDPDSDSNFWVDNELDIESRTGYVKENLTKLKQEQDILNNLHPNTIAILKLARQMTEHHNHDSLKSLEALDALVRAITFDAKLTETIKK